MPLLLLTSESMLSYFPSRRILAQQIPCTEFLREVEKLLIPSHGYLSLQAGDVSSFHSILTTIIQGKIGGAKGRLLIAIPSGVCLFPEYRQRKNF